MNDNDLREIHAAWVNRERAYVAMWRSRNRWQNAALILAGALAGSLFGPWLWALFGGS